MRSVTGIDEVGRGALAGPVVVAAAVLAPGFRAVSGAGRLALKDSKKLTSLQREVWFEYLSKHPKIVWAVSYAYPRTVDRLNISRAANLAALRAFGKLSASDGKSFVSRKNIYLDGGLYLGNGKSRVGAITAPKADERITAVKVASILAKVRRDRYMVKLAKKFPAYGFEVHKGYGVKAHMAAIKKAGVSAVHRKSFCGFA